MHDTIYQSGNTIRLSCTFKNFDGVPSDPQIVKVIIYNHRFDKLNEYVLGVSNKLDIGKYIFDFKTKMGENEHLYYEWYGEIAGNPAIRRGVIKTKFY